MPPARSGVPEGAAVVIPRLFCRDLAVEIEFCTAAFGAQERSRRQEPGGQLAHALIAIGPAPIMIEREGPAVANRAPTPDGSSPVALYVYVDNADETVERASAAGARVLKPPADQIWGDRTASIVDPSGHVWTIATRLGPSESS